MEQQEFSTTTINNEAEEAVAEETSILQIETPRNELIIGNMKNENQIQSLVNDYSPKISVKTPISTKIVLTDEIPVYERARRLAPLEKQVLSEQVSEWLRDGVIRPSHSDYASPVVLTKKKNGSFRVCIDYRRLNRKTVKDRFPIPLIEDQIDKLNGARIFSTIDMKNGFFHIPVEEESKKYTAFITPNGLYEFNKTPFGFCNSPASFGRFVRDAFVDLANEGVVMHYLHRRFNNSGVRRGRWTKKTEVSFGSGS